MRKTPWFSTVAAIAFLACGGGGGISGSSGGSTGTQPASSGGASGGSGGVATVQADAATGGVIGTGGAGSGGIPSTHETGGVSVTGGTGGASGTGGVSGSGGTGAASSAGGSPMKLDAASGSEAGSGIDAGTGGVGCEKDLSGTWDLFASSMGTGVVRGTLVISKDGFSLTTSHAQLTYNAAGTMSATWKYSNYDGPTTRLIAVQNTPAPVSSGSVPLALGGHWVLQSNRETCTLDVAGDKVTGNCTVKGADDYNVGGEDWPWDTLPSPENRVRYTISRSTTLVSQFGDFGGNWTAQSDTGSGQGCSFKLEGNTATSSCHASNSFNGNLHLTIGPDCVGSGVTPSGLEVSARRR